MSLPTSPAPGRRRWPMAAAAILAVAAAAALILRDAGPQVTVVRVTVAPLLATVVATGPVEPGERAEVTARVAGPVEQVLAQEGDLVQAGDPLAVIGQTGLLVALRQAEAEVARQESALAQVRRRAELGARQAALQVLAAETRLRAARAALTTQQQQAAARLAEAEHALALARLALEGSRLTLDDLGAARYRAEEAERKYSSLLAGGLAPEDDNVRRARAAVEKEQADLDRLAARFRAQQEQSDRQVAQAELKLTGARDEVSRLADPQGQVALQVSLAATELELAAMGAELARVLPEEEAAARTGLEAARQALARAREDLEAARVRAPLAGVVLAATPKPGEMAAPGARLFSLGRVDPVVVRARVDEADIGRVQVGQEVRVTGVGLAGRELAGQVRRLGAQAVRDGNATVVPVEVVVPNPEGLLRPGMTADVEIRVAAAPGALQVPQGAVIPAPDGGSRVFVLAGSRVQARPVQTGLATSGAVQVLAGLGAGELVVAGPPALVRDLAHGQQVRSREVGGP